MKTYLSVFSIVLVIALFTPTMPVDAATGTFHIMDDATGGNCTAIGIWDPVARECTLTTDITGSIVILSDGITLNGGGYTLTGSYDECSVYLEHRTRVTIKNLAVRQVYHYGICVRYSSGNTIISNTFLNNGLAGIYIYDSDSNTVNDNVTSSNTWGIDLSASNDNAINNNTASGNGYTGIRLSGSSGNSISNNSMLNNGIGMEVRDASDDNTLEKNTYTNSNYQNLNVSFSNGINLIENAFSNTTTGYNAWGALFYFANRSTITRNTFYGGYYGLGVDRSNDTQIYNNSFIDNTVHLAVWDGNGNVFNLPAPIGGNYWSKYDTPAEGCNNLNGDNFCDSSYQGRDQLPWTFDKGWQNRSPIADAGGPYTGFVGVSITLDASASFDPDGDALTYGWDLDNDGEYDDATGVTTTTAFNQVGEYTVGLKVTDPFDLTGSDMTTITVSPAFTVEPEEGWIGGCGWLEGTSVTFSIDDPATPNDPDHSGTTAVTNSCFQVELGGLFEIKLGFEIIVSNGVNTKSTIVTNLEIRTMANPYTDTISGTAEPGSTVVSFACDLIGCNGTNVARTVIADSFGNWVADYSVVGDLGEPVFDILPDAHLYSIQIDDDGDITKIWKWAASPVFKLNILNDSFLLGFDAWNWPLGSQVTLTVDDPGTPQNPDYTDVVTMGPGRPGGYHITHGDADLEGCGVNCHPGVTLTLSDGVQTKSMVVPLLVITGYDLANDTIFGVSDPFLRFLFPITHADGSDYVESTVVADGEGNWLLDLRGIFDLRPGDGAEPQFYDVDHDLMIILDWGVPLDITPPTITWIGNIHDGDSFHFGFVPPEPTCTATDDLSGVDGICTVSGYASTVGTYTLTATARDNAGNIATETRTYTVLAWTLKGFHQPVDMGGVYNTVKNGSTVPLKFEILAGGTELTDIALVKGLTYAQTSCNATAITDEIETTATGSTSLRYDMTVGQFIYNWKTPATANQCYRVTMTTMDGSLLAAYFKLK